MHRRLTLSLAMAAIGVGLLVASSFAGAASANSPQRAGSGEAKRGGTLRLNVSNTDFEFTDPAMAYDAIGWQMLYAVNISLLNYPDKPAPEGSRLVPEAAAGFPRVSRDGKTYTFTVRSGLKFSDGAPVTAAAFKRAIERAADPQQASPAIAFLHDVVGSFRKHAQFPTIGGTAPDNIPGIGWSDHWSFWMMGYPAIMITDTALFRYREYHTPEDTPDQVDYEKLARITLGLEPTLRDLLR